VDRDAGIEIDSRSLGHSAFPNKADTDDSATFAGVGAY
jgi:hypothetical protein